MTKHKDDATREAFKKWCADNLDCSVPDLQAVFMQDAFDGGYQAAQTTSAAVIEKLVEDAKETKLIRDPLLGDTHKVPTEKARWASEALVANRGTR